MMVGAFFPYHNSLKSVEAFEYDVSVGHQKCDIMQMCVYNIAMLPCQFVFSLLLA